MDNKLVERILDELCLAAGIRRPRAPRETLERKLEVSQLSREHGRELVGELSCEDGEFVFRYVPGYDGRPIAEFPRKDRVYRSEALWVFFVVRMPPPGRPDVQEILKGINADDPLEMLAALGRTSVANTYELRFADEGDGGSRALSRGRGARRWPWARAMRSSGR